MAEHSVHVYRDVAGGSWNRRAWALMHDAAEAYVGDLIQGIKALVPEFAVIESRFANAIRKRFGIMVTPEDERVVKQRDNAVLMAEAHRLMLSQGDGWPISEKPSSRVIRCWAPHHAELQFLIAAKELGLHKR